MTEMSVLQDVLNIAKQKHYMVLDTVSAEAPQSRSGLHLMAKKRVRFSNAIFNTAHVDHMKYTASHVHYTLQYITLGRFDIIYK